MSIESLETRRLLHGNHGDGDGHGDGDHHGGTDGLDPAIVASVREGVVAGKDVLSYVGTAYDPHVIGMPTMTVTSTSSPPPAARA